MLAVAVEYMGLEFVLPVLVEGEGPAHELVRGEITLEDPLEPAPDGPVRRVYTPIGPLLALGFDPLSPLTCAWVKTADGREWRGPEKSWLLQVPPGSTPDLTRDGLRVLGDKAELPHMADGLVWLDRVRPVLPKAQSRMRHRSRPDVLGAQLEDFCNGTRFRYVFR